MGAVGRWGAGGGGRVIGGGEWVGLLQASDHDIVNVSVIFFT